MAKFKRSRGMPVIKKCNNGDTYRFIGGVAIVPGCRFQGKPMKITLKEFRELNQ